MSIIYLSHHTVEMTDELWNFCGSFQFEESMIPLILSPVYESIRFVNIPDLPYNRAIVKCKRIDRTRSSMHIDAFFQNKQAGIGRVSGCRAMLVMDTEKGTGEHAKTSHIPIDSNGNPIANGKYDLSKLNIHASADALEKLQNAFVFVNQVLKFKPDDLELIEENIPVKEVFQHKNRQKKKRTSNSVSVATTRTYRTYRLKKGYDFSDRNPIVRSCRLWIVRGHERHLSDGRTVHIDPYYKGIDRIFAKSECENFGRKIIVKPPVQIKKENTDEAQTDK